MLFQKSGVRLLLVAFALFVSACGKSSSSDAPAAVDTTTVGGSVYAASVSGGAVVVKDASGNTIAGPVNTTSDGTYTVNIPTAALSSDLRIESSGGTYSDEATGTNTTAGTLAAYITGGSITSGGVHLDPSSTIIHDLVTKNSKTFGESQTIFSSAFGFNPDCSIMSKNVSSTGGTNGERMKAFRAGVFSQLTKDMGFTPDKQFEILTELAQDLADDGKLDGSAGADIPADIQNRFEHAMASWLSNTTVNLTGLTAADIAPLPFGKVALTNHYRVEYVPGMMAAIMGKTSFKLKITNRSDGSPATGLMVSLMPMMHMATMGHSAPVDVVAEEGSTGIYDCTAYYLMPSGAGMGYWSLQVNIGSMTGEAATFYPAVGMAMGSDTVRAMLYGPDDIISGMSGTQYNKYFLFNDGAVTASASTLKLLISHGENMNMKFVSVSGGSVLSSPTGTVTSMTMQASMDSAFTSPLSAVDNGNGHWSVSGLTGLVSAQTTTIYVKLNVNSQNKTTNGAVASGSNAYATFVVTPQ